MTITIKKKPLLNPDALEKTSDILARNTLEYWHINSIAQGRSEKHLATGEAITLVNNLKMSLGPTRPLRHQVNILNHKLIQGNKKRKKNPQPAKLLSIVL